MKMLTILAIVAIVAAVGMVGTVTAMSSIQVAHAAGTPNDNSLKVCSSTHKNLPDKCGI